MATRHPLIGKHFRRRSSNTISYSYNSWLAGAEFGWAVVPDLWQKQKRPSHQVWEVLLIRHTSVWEVTSLARLSKAKWRDHPQAKIWLCHFEKSALPGRPQPLCSNPHIQRWQSNYGRLLASFAQIHDQHSQNIHTEKAKFNVRAFGNRGLSS